LPKIIILNEGGSKIIINLPDERNGIFEIRGIGK